MLRIPAELLPRDGRFGSGPSKVPPSALDDLAGNAAAIMGTSHRQPPVRTVVARIRSGVAELLDVPDGHQVVLGNGGSTAFWDAAAFGLIERRAQHVTCGEFSAKFAAVTSGAPFLDSPHVLGSEPGAGRRPEPDDAVDAYCWPQNETSTGVTVPVAPVAGDGLTIVDATSAAGAVVTDLTGIDAYYFAPQKVFAADGGLWLAVLSPRALERIERIAASGRWIPPSLSLALAVDNAGRQQTYNTPAIASLWLLAHSTRWLLNSGGVAWAAARSAESARRLYDWAEASPFATPFVADPAWRSPVVGTVDLDPGVDADAVAATLRANAIVDTEPYRGLKRNQLRIGMYPAVDPDDVSALTACIDYVVASL